MKRISLILIIFQLFSCGASSEKNKTKINFLNNIQGKWSITEIKSITEKELKKNRRNPSLRISKEKISGNNGCNNYYSSIKTFSKENITFSPVVETKMLCANMKIPGLFSLFLSKTNTYSIHKNTLIFFNEDKEKVLVFTKG